MPTPRRRKEDAFDAVVGPTDAELPGHTYRELHRLRLEFESYRAAVDERLDRIEQAIFGYADGTIWVTGLLQNVSDMRESAVTAAAQAVKASEAAASSRVRVRQNLYMAIVILAVGLLNGLFPHWGSAFGGAVSSVARLFHG